MQIQRALKSTVHFLNQPPVKEGIKKIAGCVTFSFGLVEMYDLCQILRGRRLSIEPISASSKWMLAANKTILLAAKLSLILSAGVSKPGVYLISTVVGKIYSQEALDRVFGPNTIFQVNPWHPRHVVSIVAVILALPANIQAVGQGLQWVSRKIGCMAREYPQKGETPAELSTSYCLSNIKVQAMACFNTLTARPTLHVGNQLARRFSLAA